jgi:Flp pilus assembly protein CpaB
VLQDIVVMAVGPDTRQAPKGTGLEPQGTQIIVLEVTPQQAEQIEFAKQYTSVALTLLPKDATYTPFESRGVVVDDLFDLLDRIEEQLQQVGASLGS